MRRNLKKRERAALGMAPFTLGIFGALAALGTAIFVLELPQLRRYFRVKRM